ncbi:MAG: cytochrome P450 [Ktedonobacteraceae bacterium]|nr:cytochrome P450 [Ktedonobacteraceae bacterium]
MEKQEIQIWERGMTDAPLPPLADTQGLNEDPFLALYSKLGPIYRLPRPDQKPLVVLAGAEANAFTSRYGDEFFVSAELWKEFSDAMGGMAGGMTTMRDGEVNRKRRAQTVRSYSRTQVLDQIPRMVLITHRYAQWTSGQVIEVLPSMQRMVAEQLGQLLVNYSIGDYLEDFVLYLSTSIVSSFGAKKRDALSSPRFQRARERVMELGHAIVEAHRSAPPHNSKPDLVDEALARAGAQPEAYSETRLAFSAIGPLLAGLETVARTATFMLYALLNNPAALKRVLDEADQAFEQGELTWETLKSMSATQGAAMETLRMYTGGGFGAIVAQPLTFAGYRLEPGDEVYVAMTVPHFLPELFPHPERFDIDRYHEPRNEHRQRGAYAPFGLGEHTCLGAGIAEIQLMIIAATLLSSYQFELEPLDYQLKPGQQLTIEDDVDGTAGQQFRLKIAAMRHPV